MNAQSLLNEYAKLLVIKGANVQKNDIVVITSIIDACVLTRLVVKLCYERGAKKVIVHWDDGDIQRYDLIHQDIKTIKTIQPYEIANLSDDVVKRHASRIAIRGTSPNNLVGIDKHKIQTKIRTTANAFKPLMECITNGTVRWTIGCYPTVKWAKLVFPTLSDEQATQKLLSAIYKTVYIDGKTNVLDAWEHHTNQLLSIRQKLNKYNFQYLHFKNKIGTDIKIGLVDDHIWLCTGATENKHQQVCAHNLPSEEIWTMPDYRCVNGKVVSTKPLSYNGNVINQFTLTFKNGKVIQVQANNKQQLDILLSVDKGSKYIGEVALVPNSSPINKQNITFFSTLYDENASCHLALGQCYPTNIKNGTSMSKQTLLKHGGNYSIQHVDFMFGSEDMVVDGYTKQNKKVTIIKNGEFVI